MTVQQQLIDMQIQIDTLNQLVLGQNENFQLLVIHLLNRELVTVEGLLKDLHCVLKTHQNNAVDPVQLIPMTAWFDQLHQEASF